MTIRCDGVPAGTACERPLDYICRCARCEGEDHDERFHSCMAHIIAATGQHARVRGRSAQWEAWTNES
jgi:hypothetical protein